jgi:hypothetical protein
MTVPTSLKCDCSAAQTLVLKLPVVAIHLNKLKILLFYRV